MSDNQEIPPFTIKLKPETWWILLSLNIILILPGKSTALLLARFFYNQEVDGIWLASLLQHVAFPILIIPYLLIKYCEKTSPVSNPPSIIKLSLMYFLFGILNVGVNFLYTIGFVFASSTTFAFVFPTQLAFNAILSFFINSQKFTALILNSVIALILSVFLLAASSNTLNKPFAFVNEVNSNGLGFPCTIAASILYALLISWMQLSFKRVLKKTNYSVVLEMQIFTSVVAACASVAIYFGTGEWSSLERDVEKFGKGRVSYVMTLVWIAVAWQVFSVGLIGLIFMVSALFSNAFSTASLAITAILAAIAFHDKVNGVKAIAFLIALWGLASYLYQSYLDERKARTTQNNINSSCC